MIATKSSAHAHLVGVVVQWRNPLTLESEQSDGMGSAPGRTPPFERDDKG